MKRTNQAFVRRMAAGFAVAALVVGGASAGHAAEATQQEETAGVVADFAVEPGESVEISEEEIAELRESDAADELLTDKQVDAATDELVEEAAEHGQFISPEEVDVIPLLGGDVTLAITEDSVVEEATVAVSENGEIDASAQTAEAAPTSVAMAGPGMAASWNKNGGGTHKLKIYVDFNFDGQGHRLYASGTFRWDRWKQADTKTKEVYRYERTGDFQPENLPIISDAKATRLRIQTFPFDSAEKHLKELIKHSPASDRDDSCDSYSASVSYKAVSFSVPFNARCGRYNMWRNIDKANSYWIQYENNDGGGGNREVAFILIWSQTKGTAGSVHDLNQIRTLLPEVCQQTDGDKTCKWY